VPDGIDTAMYSMQAALARSLQNLAFAQPRFAKLPGGGHAVLP
jgi:hypothetical protein